MAIDILLNNDPVLQLSMHLPMKGAWSAELQVASESEYVVGDIVTLNMPGDVVFTSRVVRAAIFADRLSLRLTGGTVDWTAPTEVKHYKNTTADQIVTDAGVTLDAATNITLPFWTRSPGTPGSTVEEVAKYLNVNWRVNPDGTIRMRAETPAAVTADAIEVTRNPARGLVEVAPETTAILPGVIVGDDTVGDVIYEMDSEFRCRYYTESRDRLRGALEKIVRWVMRDTMYLANYSAEVIRQAADGTLDLMPEDDRLKAQGLQSIPIRHGLPGVEVEVDPGETVLLAFDGGDPSKPYCSLWHEGQVKKVRIGGTEAVALASLVTARLDAIQQKFDVHTHLVATTGTAAAQSGTASATTGIIGPLEPVASEVLETR